MWLGEEEWCLPPRASTLLAPLPTPFELVGLPHPAGFSAWRNNSRLVFWSLPLGLMVQGSQTFSPSWCVGSHSRAGKCGYAERAECPVWLMLSPHPLAWFGSAGMLGSCAKLGCLNCISWGGLCPGPRLAIAGLCCYIVWRQNLTPLPSACTALEEKEVPALFLWETFGSALPSRIPLLG